MVCLQRVRVHNAGEKSKRGTSNNRVVARAGTAATRANHGVSQGIQPPVRILLGSKTIMSDKSFHMSRETKRNNPQGSIDRSGR